MNRDTFNGRDLQIAQAIYQTYLAEGVTDLRAMSERLAREIDQRIKNLAPDRQLSRPGLPAEEGDRKEMQKEMTTRRKARAKMIANAPVCPSCGEGKLFPSCRNTVTCSYDCGYSAMRDK